MRKSVVAVGALVVIGVVAFAATSTDWGRGIVGGTATGEASARTPARAQTVPPVETAITRVERARLEIQSVGSLASDESVVLAAEVAGRVADIRFTEGAAVRKGDVLVELDKALLTAELADAVARGKLAEANFERANSLSQSGIGTQRAKDEAIANLATARAAQELVQVRIDKTAIRAPFDGVMGLRRVSNGAYVQAGTEIANLEKIDTLKVDFRLPENNLADVQIGQEVDIQIDALPNRTFRGEIYAIDPLIDVNGRALKVRARLPNTDNALRPGLFARVKVIGADRGAVVVVPEGAIVPRAGEAFVFKVQDGKAVETKVVLGQRRRGEVEVTEGLAEGEVVVVSGQARVRNGGQVEVVGQAPVS